MTTPSDDARKAAEEAVRLARINLITYRQTLANACISDNERASKTSSYGVGFEHGYLSGHAAGLAAAAKRALEIVNRVWTSTAPWEDLSVDRDTLFEELNSPITAAEIAAEEKGQ